MWMTMEFIQTWMNWSVRRFLKSLCDWPQVTGGSYQISPSPFDVNKNFILCIHWWFSLTLNWKHLLNSTLLVPFDVNKNFILCIHWWFSLTLNWKHLFNSTLLMPLYNRIQYFTHKAHALCDIGNLANFPYKHVLLEYLLTFKAFFHEWGMDPFKRIFVFRNRIFK